MPNVRASSGTIGTTSLPSSLSRSSFDSIRTNTIVVDALRPSVPPWNSSKSSDRDLRERLAARFPARHVAAERRAAFLEVFDLGAVVGGAIERRLGDFAVGDRNREAAAEGAQLLFVHLLLLMGDVLAFAGLAETVALDRAGEDDGRAALVLGGGLVGGVDLDGIVAAERELLQLVVAQMLDHVEQARDRRPRSARGRRRPIRPRTSDIARRRPRPCVSRAGRRGPWRATDPTRGPRAP